MAKSNRKAPPKPRPKSGSGSAVNSVETTEKARSTEKNKISAPTMDMAFGRVNYIFMLAGIAIMVLGYVLMAGGGSDDPNKFNPDIFGFQRITLAPLMIMLGIFVEIYAILKKSE